MMRRLTVTLVALAALIGVGWAGIPGTESFQPERDSTVGGAGVFNSMQMRGPTMYWVNNASLTDTLFRGDVVGFDPTVITVVTKYNIGAVYDTGTIADAITTTLDTLFFIPRGYGENVPAYDTSKNGQYYLRMRFARPGAGATDTVYARIHVYDNKGQPQWIRWDATGAGTIYDTIFTWFPISKVDSVYVLGDHANDSVGFYAHAIGGVQTSTTLCTDEDSLSYAGVMQATVLPRDRGPMARTGPNAWVKVNATITDITNGMWLTPSATERYADAMSESIPNVAIGRVTHYNQANGACLAMLEEPFYGGTTFSLIFNNLDTVEAGIDSLQAGLDTAQASIDSLQSEADSIAAGLDSAQAEIDSVKVDVATGAAGIDSSQAAIDSLQSEADSIAAGLDSAQAEIDSVKVDVATGAAGIDSLQAGLDSAQAEIDSVRSEIELSGTPLWRTTFRAGSFVIAADSGPALIQADSTNFSWDALAFDQTAQEQAYILDCVEGYTLTDTADSVHVLVAWTSTSASTDSVKWLIDFVARGDGQLFDSTLGLGGWMADANQGAGVLNIVEASYSVTVCGVDDILSFSIGRDPSVAANLAEDAQLVMVRFTYFKASAGYEQ